MQDDPIKTALREELMRRIERIDEELRENRFGTFAGTDWMLITVLFLLLPTIAVWYAGP
jgi:hypothetical protein